MQVRVAVSRRLSAGGSLSIIADDLKGARLEAYRELINGLLRCGAFWDGEIEVKKALRVFPNDTVLKELQEILREGFAMKTLELEERCEREDREFCGATTLPYDENH